MIRIRRPRRSGYWIWVCSRPNPRDLKSENMGSMPQRSAYPKVVRYPGLAAPACAGAGYGDDPGLGMSGIANDADIGRDALAGEGDSFEIVAAGQGETAGGGSCRTPAGDEIALEPQPIVPPAIATPPDHLRGSVEAISEQDHSLIRRQPVGDHREQLLLRSEANGALGLFDPPEMLWGERRGNGTIVAVSKPTGVPHATGQ